MVPTSLSNCNTKLSFVGGFISTLKYIGISSIGTHTLASIAPGFHSVNLINPHIYKGGYLSNYN